MLTTPERLASDADFVALLKKRRVARIVVDEAHCVSQWGHDFRPAYTELKQVIARLGHPPVLALTATATPAVAEDIVTSLGMRDARIVNTGIFRPNLQLAARQTPSDEINGFNSSNCCAALTAWALCTPPASSRLRRSTPSSPPLALRPRGITAG